MERDNERQVPQVVMPGILRLDDGIIDLVLSIGDKLKRGGRTAAAIEFTGISSGSCSSSPWRHFALPSGTSWPLLPLPGRVNTQAFFKND